MLTAQCVHIHRNRPSIELFLTTKQTRSFYLDLHQLTAVLEACEHVACLTAFAGFLAYAVGAE